MVDDSVKERKGKKLEAVSRHFDHILGRTVKGQQVLTLGLATEDHFLVLNKGTNRNIRISVSDLAA